MAMRCFVSSSSLHTKNHTVGSRWSKSHLKHTIICLKLRIYKQKDQEVLHLRSKACIKNGKQDVVELSKEDEKKKKKEEEKGSVGGAVALIIGTSIGSGMLALPDKASPAGLFPSSVTVIICWGFLLVEALLLIEINVGLRRKKKRKEAEAEEEEEEEDMNELEVISIRTMAKETLGEFGGTIATFTYIFLGYTSLIAYSSKSGQLLFHLINLPPPISAFLFTSLFTFLISLGGTKATDQVNQYLTASMIGLLVAIEVLAVVVGGWIGVDSIADWGKVRAAIPVIIFTLVYHDLLPVLCAYLGGDLFRLRLSVFLGSIVPLMALLIWDAIALGISAQTGQLVDPVELLMRLGWSEISYMVEAFSLLAVGTSLLGTLLSFFEFFKEQLKNLTWERDKISITAMAIAVAPSLIVSTTVPDSFSAATDIAGGYCMTMLYGILPPAMMWARSEQEAEKTEPKGLWRSRPALLGIGLFACGIMLEKIMQDIVALHS